MSVDGDGVVCLWEYQQGQLLSSIRIQHDDFIPEDLVVLDDQVVLRGKREAVIHLLSIDAPSKSFREKVQQIDVVVPPQSMTVVETKLVLTHAQAPFVSVYSRNHLKLWDKIIGEHEPVLEKVRRISEQLGEEKMETTGESWNKNNVLELKKKKIRSV